MPAQHLHTHTYTHTNTHTNTHTLTHARTHARTHAQCHTYANKIIHIHMLCRKIRVSAKHQNIYAQRVRDEKRE